MAKLPPWTVKGVSDDARGAARESAQHAGMTIGAWVDHAILAAAAGEASTAADATAAARPTALWFERAAPGARPVPAGPQPRSQPAEARPPVSRPPDAVAAAIEGLTARIADSDERLDRMVTPLMRAVATLEQRLGTIDARVQQEAPRAPAEPVAAAATVVAADETTDFAAIPRRDVAPEPAPAADTPVDDVFKQPPAVDAPADEEPESARANAPPVVQPEEHLPEAPPVEQTEEPLPEVPPVEEPEEPRAEVPLDDHAWTTPAPTDEPDRADAAAAPAWSGPHLVEDTAGAAVEEDPYDAAIAAHHRPRLVGVEAPEPEPADVAETDVPAADGAETVPPVDLLAPAAPVPPVIVRRPRRRRLVRRLLTVCLVVSLVVLGGFAFLAFESEQPPEVVLGSGPIKGIPFSGEA